MAAPAIFPFVKVAVDAYLANQAAQESAAWKEEVSQSLASIHTKLDSIAEGVRSIQIAVAELPGQIESMFQNAAVGTVQARTVSVMEQVPAVTKSNAKDLAPTMWIFANELSTAEGALEAQFKYSGYAASVNSFLARVAVYRALSLADASAAESTFKAARSRKVAWLRAGCLKSAEASGPGATLQDLEQYLEEINRFFDLLENGSGLRIGWLERDTNGLLSTSGAPTNQHYKLTQQSLEGNRNGGFNAKMKWQTDSNWINGPTPNWGGNEFLEVPGTPPIRLNGIFSGSLDHIGFSARERVLTAVGYHVAHRKAVTVSVDQLRPIVTDICSVADELERLKL